MAGSFVKNSAITLFARIANTAFGLIISILLARGLGPGDRGIYALAILAPSLAILFVGAGLNSSTVYLLSRKKYEPGLIAGNNLLLNLFLGGLGMILSVIMIVIFKNQYFSEVPLYALASVVLVIPFTLYNSNEVAIAQGLQRYGLYNIVNSIHVLLQFALLAGLFLTKSLTLSTALLAYFLSAIFNSIVLSLAVKRLVGHIRLRLSRDYVRESLRFGIQAQLSNVVAYLHLRVDQLILAVMTNPITVGYYAVATGLTERLWLLSESVSVIHYSQMSAETNEERRRRFTPILTRNTVWITTLGAIFLIFISHWLIVLFYSAEFLSAILPFNILLFGTISVSGARILANDITARGMPIINTRVNSYSVVVNIILNLILVPLYGLMGAALASTVSYTLLFLFRARAYNQLSGNKMSDLLIIRAGDFALYRTIWQQLKKRFVPIEPRTE